LFSHLSDFVLAWARTIQKSISSSKNESRSSNVIFLKRDCVAQATFLDLNLLFSLVIQGTLWCYTLKCGYIDLSVIGMFINDEYIIWIKVTNLENNRLLHILIDYSK